MEENVDSSDESEVERSDGADSQSNRSPRSDGGQPTAPGQPDVDYLRGSIALFGAIGVGALLMNYLYLELADNVTVAGGFATPGSPQRLPQGEELFLGLLSAFNNVIAVSVVLAAALGGYVYWTGDGLESTPKTSAIAAAAGVACTLLALLVLIVGTAPDSVDPDWGELLKPVIAVTIGTAVAAAGTAYAMENWLAP